MLKEIKGIGPKTLIELNKLNINNIEDLITYYPYRYNYYQVEDISKATENKEIAITGVIETLPKIYYIRRNLNTMSFNLNTSNIIIKVNMFNRAFIKNHLTIGKTITVIGNYNKLKNTFTASDLKLKPLSKNEVEPVYHLTKNIKKQSFRNMVKESLKYLDQVPNYVPKDHLEKYNFINKKSAIINIHNPSNLSSLKQSKLMLTYEELFIFMLKINYLKLKKQKTKQENIKIFKNEDVQKLINNLPFKLTDDQNQVVNEIVEDFKSNKRMNRLILGDVGSGKTIVSFIALYINYLAGYQGVLMAPTEILVNQHYDNFHKLFKNINLKFAVLTSSTKNKERTLIIEKLKNKELDIIISTHSVLNEEIEFKNLGLVITDEQHRFGVKQRRNLQDKGSEVDVIYMSATPIPRTLALTIYGDMDISQIKTKPSNNKPVITKLMKEKEIKVVLTEILEEIKKGHQAYVIVPLALENEESELEDVKSIYDKFNLAFNKKIPMEVIHGKLKASEKSAIMERFQNNETKILISTTVIEVGIDVKNATIITIFNAERFGLATLHQLRGRVGRSDLQSKCYLISDYEKERLNVLEESNDGFYISEKDFELRGTGDLFGVRQSGDMVFKLANLKTDFKILLQCKKDSEEFLRNNLKNLSNFPEQKKVINDINFID